jgi:hypothetical protein
MESRDRQFVAFWIIAAVLGVLSVPNFYSHYTLPLLPPLAIASSLMLGRRDVGLFLLSMLALFTIALYNPFDRAERRLSIRSMEEMAQAIRRHASGQPLLVYDGPSYLYALSGKHPPSPLAFPPHLNHRIERNVSQFNTRNEVRNVLRMKPGVVVVSVFPSAQPANDDIRGLVMNYVQNNCRIVDVATSYGYGGRMPIAIWGDCYQGAPDLTQ